MDICVCTVYQVCAVCMHAGMQVCMYVCISLYLYFSVSESIRVHKYQTIHLNSSLTCTAVRVGQWRVIIFEPQVFENFSEMEEQKHLR